jgi:hypothetical protein
MLGLHAPPVPKLMKKPKSYLEKVTRDNAQLIQSWRRPALPLAAGSPPSAR